MTIGQPYAAICQIHDRGILAIGRCATCGRAFCASHQARTFDGRLSYVDMCSECFANSPAEKERVQRSQHNAEISSAIEYFESGSARSALLISSALTVNISWFAGARLQRGLFGLGGRYIDVTGQSRGWLVGKFQWGDESRLTAVLDLSRHELPSGEWSGLARVRPTSEGYEAIDIGRSSLQPDHEELIKIAAVREMTRT